MVRCGSYFHQLRPICSALSTEQIRRRMRIVSSSTFAKETRTSPAITNPLSRTRSRISTRLVVPETVGTLSISVGAAKRSDFRTETTMLTAQLVSVNLVNQIRQIGRRSIGCRF